MKCIFLVFSLCCVFALSGCRSVSGTGVASDSPFHETAFGDKARVQLEGLLLNSAINVDRVDAQRLDSGLLKVFVVLRNTGSKDRWVKIRTTFLDSNNHQFDQTNWEPFFIDRRNVIEYTCTSLNSQASDFQVLVYENK